MASLVWPKNIDPKLQMEWYKIRDMLFGRNYVCQNIPLAIIELGDLLDASDPQRWQLWGRAETLGANSNFLPNFAKQVELFNSGYGSAAVMFAIGQALQGQVNEQARTIFNTTYKFNACISSAKQAIAFYEAQIKATKDAMRAWTQVGIRLHVVKDIRKLIAALIWDTREEALYFQVTKILVLPFK